MEIISRTVLWCEFWLSNYAERNHFVTGGLWVWWCHNLHSISTHQPHRNPLKHAFVIRCVTKSVLSLFSFIHSSILFLFFILIFFYSILKFCYSISLIFLYSILFFIFLFYSVFLFSFSFTVAGLGHAWSLYFLMHGVCNSTRLKAPRHRFIGNRTQIKTYVNIYIYKICIWRCRCI